MVFKNMRMGVGMTGIMQASPEQIEWLDECYLVLRAYDEEYSRDHGWNPSIKLTTVKPSGTLSLLPGVTPGIHPGYARYMIRRITVASDHSLIEVCRANGYPMEYKKNFDGTFDYNSMIVSFPFEYPEGTILAEEMTAISQMQWIQKLQRIWSDNSVSCTIYYRKEELPEIREYLRLHYRDGFKTLSFLLHSDHGFDQAPYEAVSKEVFDELAAKVTRITSIAAAEFEGGDECASGVCPIK